MAACAGHADAETRSARMTALLEMLPRAAEAAPRPEDAVQSARQGLASSVQRLDQLLASAGPEKHRGWRHWLNLPGLEAELAREQPNPKVLDWHVSRYSADVAGLELPAAVSVRKELLRLLTAVEYASSDSPEQVVQARVMELSSLLSRLDYEPTSEEAKRAGELLGWLEALGGEGQRVANAVRAEYCRTNGVAQGSVRLLNVLMQRSVSDQRSFAETVLGSFTWGTAFTQANVSFGFVPSQDRATLQLRMLGLTRMPGSVAETRRVWVYSSATTSIRAGKDVYLTAEGLQLVPSVAAATTNMQINDIDAGRRFIERIAWRRAGQMVPQAEQLASQRAQSEASTRLDREAAAALAGMNNMFREKIRAALIRQNALPADWRFWTDLAHIRMAMTQANDSQLAVATPVPNLSPGYDVALAAHESMIVNLAESMLGGSTIKDETWLEIIKLLTGEEPRALWVHDRSPRWSVTLDEERPIVPRFEGDRAAFTLRLIEVARGDEVFDHPVEIEAEFGLGSSADGPTLRRDQELTIRFPSEPSLDSRAATEKFLRQKFNAEFPEELVFYGLVPPDGGSLGKLNQLELAEFHTARGWMSLGYSLREAE